MSIISHGRVAMCSHNWPTINQHFIKSSFIMKPQVIVTADQAGNVITPSKNNPEWGYVRVEEGRVEINEKNFARRVTLSALVYGRLEDLAAFGWKDGTVLSGRVLVQESFDPFNDKNPEKDLKIAGSTGIVCEGADPETGEIRPIYRKNIYDPSATAEAQDCTIDHVNGEEIRAAYLAAKNNEAVSSAQGEGFNI